MHSGNFELKEPPRSGRQIVIYIDKITEIIESGRDGGLLGIYKVLKRIRADRETVEMINKLQSGLHEQEPVRNVSLEIIERRSGTSSTASGNAVTAVQQSRREFQNTLKPICSKNTQRFVSICAHKPLNPNFGSTFMIPY